MAHLKIHLGHYGTDEVQIEVDGIEISHLVRDFDLNINPSEPPRVVVELGVIQDITLSGEATLIMNSGTSDLLKEWGWTPPAPGRGVRDDD